MVITPRQVQNHSQEISTLKNELAALKDEVSSLSAHLQLIVIRVHIPVACPRTASLHRLGQECYCSISGISSNK